jgi:hypothetical protein
MSTIRTLNSPVETSTWLYNHPNRQKGAGIECCGNSISNEVLIPNVWHCSAITNFSSFEITTHLSSQFLFVNPLYTYWYFIYMSAPLTTAGSTSTRRSTRPRRSADSKKPLKSSSPSDSHRGDSQSLDPDGSHNGKSTAPRTLNAKVSPNPQPWRHPDEFSYVQHHDLSQNVLIEYLRRNVFTIPPRELNSTISLFQVTTLDGTVIALPRGYRVPLMFVTKFQWDSLMLVLTSENPQTEWEEYKFDIFHLSRLCQHLFVQAEEARQHALPRGIDRFWRCATFDRVLTRFYHRWFISREWSLRKFWQEFDEEEYENDVLKHGGYFLTLS